MGGFGRFLAYNNAVPVAVSILLLGGGSVFAATNPEAIYDKSQTVVSVDNSYIVSVDLDSFTPVLQIGAVTEDDMSYYIAYELETIDVVDGTWQGAVKKGTLTVAKRILGEYRDLGLYATEQFKQVIDHEIAYLREVQSIEKRALTPKMVATAYSGLVGLFLDDSTETLPGYVPVVTPPVVEAPVAREDSDSNEASQPPRVQLLGESPLFIALNSSYTDLGVVTQDDEDAQPEIRIYVDGSLISGTVSLDTSTAKNWFIRYHVTDSDGLSNSVERIVVVGDPHAPADEEPAEEEPTSGGSETPDTGASTTPEVPAEEPAEETPAEETPAEETPEEETPAAEEPAEAPAEEPAPAPEPEPTPTPEPASEPTPEPASEPTPEPAPAPEPEAAVTP